MTHIFSRIGYRSVAALVLTFGAVSMPLVAQHYLQTNLVSDQTGAAAAADPNLVNPWGMSRSSGSPWWLSDNGTGLSTLYTGTGTAESLVVTIPTGDPTMSVTGTPSGTVYNGGIGFVLPNGKPAVFMFVTEDGTISGWNGGTAAVITVNTKSASVFKGVALDTIDIPFFGSSTYIYVADFRKGRIQVYDSSFHHVGAMDGLFRDDWLPPGYAPFSIQNIGGELYVTYAKQDSQKHDEVDGAGLGFVDVFSPFGFLLRRMQHGPWLNGPWALALASGDFGIYSHDLLVGQFGSGQIAVYDPVTGAFKGLLEDSTNTPIAIDGLWGLSFGSGGTSGPANTLYFTAGPDGENHGLFGTLTAVENTLGNSQ
ncbi:MAG: TIGR03118 family protein [Acidobacteriaceae bacterium]